MYLESPASSAEALEKFREIVGSANVLKSDRLTERYSRGYRYGQGKVLAVVRPGNLVEQWRVLNVAVAHDFIIIIQAANTGLTGGSTPFGEDYERPVVILNLMRVKRIDVIQNGEEVICQPGSTLVELEEALKPYGREPHSVIGSTCIGASVTGGICNNSGGALIKRGPAFTQMALYAKLDEKGKLVLVNHLGVELDEDPETLLGMLDKGDYAESAITPQGEKWCSDREYLSHVRDINSPEPARYNADPRKLYEVSGCAGKLAVFAVRLDTFPQDLDSKVFYIGTNSTATLQEIRQDILSSFKSLPIAGEYLHRESYSMTATYGKDLFLLTKLFGARSIPKAFAVKSSFDSLAKRYRFLHGLSDKVIQKLMRYLPNHLPVRMNEYHSRFDHHLIIRMGQEGLEELRSYLKSKISNCDTDFFECNKVEGDDAFTHRFAVGAASIRYRTINQSKVQDILSLDVALPRNEKEWLPEIPQSLKSKIIATNICAHFFCHVIHLDYMVGKGENIAEIKDELLKVMRARGAKYPAEHNVGHIYEAGAEQKKFFQALDPCNRFNPGIGKTTRRKFWGSHLESKESVNDRCGQGQK
ncbi:D-lactate dehydrogenase [Pseudomonas synxantha]|uniref:D-lactate dehydrogenase n=1 Tax=Pseudomonas synxantha TaxID=47883 RepID=A0ABS0USL2_9PSED|nr:D-lactate dehydrogenase [Pseudomonas synxantha]MBI6567535.1 D-lactate dehydrogenase [Pseudomonas synxantha]MBI6582350.1 D-lactate dehydrogenase [Pseudomonas synxantha]MBI6645407.1 D-lactate dehydrogenase [Pseudomonas synxantha]